MGWKSGQAYSQYLRNRVMATVNGGMGVPAPDRCIGAALQQPLPAMRTRQRFHKRRVGAAPGGNCVQQSELKMLIEGYCIESRHGLVVRPSGKDQSGRSQSAPAARAEEPRTVKTQRPPV